ncbi:WXG100 family type VII secretion target [Streptomyces sp. Da 82-17]|uniref:WXG100 family type VII secretion target n=1 Tax=Streptomyces sp. Da 82-17 TaxID=3377116 RepID=UPI0038D515B8
MAYGYGGAYMTPEQIEAQQRAREQRIQEKHDELLEEQPNGGMGGPDRSQIETPFMKMSIPELRSMILDADPDRIYEVSQHWKKVHEILSGGEAGGEPAKDSVAGMLKKAVEDVLEHWQGEAANSFARKAGEIQTKVSNGALWAKHNADNMEAVQKDLRTSREKMREVEEPGFWDRAWDKMWDDERSDEQLLEDIKKGASTEAAAKANADSLSAGKEAQLQGVAIMEQLAVNYKAYSGRVDGTDPKDPFSPPDPSTPMPTPVVPSGPGGSGPGAAGSAPKPWSAGPPKGIGSAPTVPGPKGISGGSQLPVGTNTDSLSPGLTGKTSLPGGGGAGLPGGGGGGAGAGGGFVPPAGGPSLSGGAGRTGGPLAGGRGGIGAGGAAGANRGAAGRAGMGGMGGGMGAGAAGRGAAGAGGRGALAKARGGVVGAAKGITGKGTGGGAGLHGSRGGSQRTGGMAGGMAGGMGGRAGRRGEENERGERPDYLVEDEETWVSEEDRKRNVPKNIE